MPATLFKRLILRAVLRDVYPMVIRLVAVPDSLDLTDIDDIFHAVLGRDSGIGYAFRIQCEPRAYMCDSLGRMPEGRTIYEKKYHGKFKSWSVTTSCSEKSCCVCQVFEIN